MRLHAGGEFLLAPRQFLEGNAFGVLDTGEDHAGVDARNEALLDRSGEPHHGAEHRGRQQQHDPAMTHRSAQRDGIAIAETAERRIERARQDIVRHPWRQTARAQHGCERQRDYPGEQHGDTDRHRKLLEQAPDHVAHEQDGQEYRGERDRHRHHGETDFLCAVERRLQAGLAHVEVTRDVLDHHHRVVDDEADRQGDRHQRQVVEAVAGQMHEGEGAEQRTRQHQRGDERGAQIVQERIDDQDHQCERQQQGEVDLAQ